MPAMAAYMALLPKEQIAPRFKTTLEEVPRAIIFCQLCHATFVHEPIPAGFPPG